ncbi:MAG: ECF transporter S component [Lawsonibacter sp.]|jgi:uncharacterized membrane protein|nr:ECF transporter S component [Lawsonibacter sp.]
MKTRRYDTRWIALMALFIAIQLFLNLSGIGLIPLPVIKGTTLHIPVIVGAVILGPMAGGILGGVFGLCSIWNNTMSPALLSFALSPYIAAQELGAAGAAKSLWIALGCRILIGVVAGWLWIGLKRLKVNDFAALPIVGAAGAMTNTILVMGSIYLLLSPEYAAAKGIAMDAVLGAVLGVIGSSGVVEAIGAVILVTAICKALFRVPNVRAQATAG